MPDETRAAATENTPTARKTADASGDEPRIAVERFAELAPQFAQELGRPVSRGTVAGALHRLSLERGAHMPKTLARSDMKAAITAYLDSEA